MSTSVPPNTLSDLILTSSLLFTVSIPNFLKGFLTKISFTYFSLCPLVITLVHRSPQNVAIRCSTGGHV